MAIAGSLRTNAANSPSGLVVLDLVGLPGPCVFRGGLDSGFESDAAAAFSSVTGSSNTVAEPSFIRMCFPHPPIPRPAVRVEHHPLALSAEALELQLLLLGGRRDGQDREEQRGQDERAEGRRMMDISSSLVQVDAHRVQALESCGVVIHPVGDDPIDAIHMRRPEGRRGIRGLRPHMAEPRQELGQSQLAELEVGRPVGRPEAGSAAGSACSESLRTDPRSDGGRGSRAARRRTGSSLHRPRACAMASLSGHQRSRRSSFVRRVPEQPERLPPRDQRLCRRQAWSTACSGRPGMSGRVALGLQRA